MGAPRFGGIEGRDGMTKDDRELQAIEVALFGSDAKTQLPGTRPDLATEMDAVNRQLAPLLDLTPEAEPPADLFSAIEAELDGAGASPMQTIRAEEGAWIRRSDKVWKKIIGEDRDTGRQTYLLRCLPGAVIPSHPHDRAEHLIVLEGELWIADKLYSAGDAQVCQPGSAHGDISMPTGCLVLVSV